MRLQARDFDSSMASSGAPWASKNVLLPLAAHEKLRLGSAAGITFIFRVSISF